MKKLRRMIFQCLTVNWSKSLAMILLLPQFDVAEATPRPMVIATLKTSLH